MPDSIEARLARGRWLQQHQDPRLLRLAHCYVQVDEHGVVPALLLEWRETPSGRQARVVRPVLDATYGWQAREEWLAAGGVAGGFTHGQMKEAPPARG